MAGVIWLKIFMERHPNLSLRLPEGTAGATSFNEANVAKFFANYKGVLSKHYYNKCLLIKAHIKVHILHKSYD